MADLVRLHGFLEPVDPVAAARTARALVTRVRRIPVQPRLGVPLTEFLPREVRRVVLGKYEIRYEIAGHSVYVLRLFHTREQR